MTTTESFRNLPLDDLVLAVLSLAAKKGRTKIPLKEFYKAFAQLVDEHGGLFPPMLFTETGDSAYSKRLDDALQLLLGYGVDLPNPVLRYLEVPEDVADHHLTWLHRKYDKDDFPSWIDDLQPIVDQFVSKVSKL